MRLFFKFIKRCLTRPTTLRKSLALAFILSINLTASATSAAPLISTIISTQKPASQLIDHLSPLIKPPASITAMDHQLIIRANPKSVVEIKNILATIDVAPENLVIQIRKYIAPPYQPSPQHSGAKIIRTRALREPKITTYRSIEGEELIIQQADAPEFLLQWPIFQTAPNRSFSLTLNAQRIGERLQLRYRFEETSPSKSVRSTNQSSQVEGVLLGHMDSWIDLNPNPTLHSSPQHKSPPKPKNAPSRRLATDLANDTPLWQIKVQREH